MGAIVGVFLLLLRLRKNKLLWMFMQAQRNNQGIAFMEDQTKITVQKVVRSYQNISETEDGSQIIVTEGSVKPIGGTTMMVVHGDMYRSITTPMALRRFIWERVREGWKADDVANFIEDIEKMKSDEDLRKKYKDLKKASEIKEEIGKEIQEIEIKLADKNLPKTEKANLKLKLEKKYADLEPYKALTKADKMKYDVYLGLPSSIAAYVNTGLNRASINMQHDLKIRTASLLAGKKMRQWLPIIIGIGFMMLLIGMALKFGGPALAEILNSGSQVASTTVTPTTLPQRIFPGG